MKFQKTTKKVLDLLLEEGEGFNLEFKENINSDFPKELVAFANASGGRILIGVDDSGKVVGLTISNSLVSRIQDSAAACDPPVPIHIEKLKSQNIIVVHVPKGNNRPHRCGKGFFLRNGANSQKMKTEDITYMIQSEGKISFEQKLRLDLNWKEVLDEGRLNHFLELAGITTRKDIENLLLNLDVGGYKDDKFYLNQAGVLFFAKEPTLRLYHVSVVCALFKGTDKVYILDRKELKGSILENVEDAILFLQRHLNLRWEITSESLRRKEILELPELALREAMVNAVCHRDYLEEGAQVMVEIFDDRVEIYNPGGLPRGLPEKDFGKRSVCRNPLIAGLLLRCDYIEKMGTGIRRIKQALSREKCPAVIPSFGAFFTLNFPRPGYESEKRPESRLESRPESAEEIPTQSPTQSPTQLNDSILKLLDILTEKELSSGELRERLRLKHRPSFRENYLHPALKDGLIEMTIPEKPGSRLQKYRITEKGLNILTNLN